MKLASYLLGHKQKLVTQETLVSLRICLEWAFEISEM